MKRVYSLDLLKLALAYVVALGHIDVIIQPKSEVAVQVFFMISGFFLARKFCGKKGTEYDQWNYTLDHVKSVYPHYLFSLVAIFGYLTCRSLVYFVKAPTVAAARDIFISVYDQIPDLLLVQSAFHYHDSMNYPLWQLSALLIGGYFVYGLLVYNEKLSLKMIFPVCILMIQSLLQNGLDLWANYGPLYLPLLRAFSPLCIGVYTYYFSNTVFFTGVKKHRVWFDLAGIYALITLFTIGSHDYVFLLTVPVLLLNCMDPDSVINKVFNRRVFRYAGKFSYAVYLNHALIQRLTFARVIPTLGRKMGMLHRWQECAIYLLLLSVYSVATLIVVEKISGHIQRKRKMRV